MRERRHSFNKRPFYKKRRFQRRDDKIRYSKRHQRYIKPTEHQIIESFFGSLLALIKWPFMRHRVKKAQLKDLDKEKVKYRWAIVEDLYNKRDFRAVIIEADKIIEYTLEHMNFEGNNYAERLQNAKIKFSSSVFNSLWEARRSRNRVVHEMEHEITSFEAKNIMDKIFRALRELNVL